jgi:hypothetical protein
LAARVNGPEKISRHAHILGIPKALDASVSLVNRRTGHKNVQLRPVSQFQTQHLRARSF